MPAALRDPWKETFQDLCEGGGAQRGVQDRLAPGPAPADGAVRRDGEEAGLIGDDVVHQQQVGDVLHRERGAALSSPGIQGIAPDRLLDGRRATPGGDIEDGRSRVPAQRVKPAAGCDVRGVLLTRIGAIEPVQASIASMVYTK